MVYARLRTLVGNLLLLALASSYGAEIVLAPTAAEEPAPTLPGTQPLTLEGDLATQLVAGVDRFLLRKLAEARETRGQNWRPNFSSVEAYNASLVEQRARLARLLGVRDERVPFEAPERVADLASSAAEARGRENGVWAIRWPVLDDPDRLRTGATVHGEGMLLEPEGEGHAVADVIALPDADQTPEQIAGLAAGVPPSSQFARLLANMGCRVVAPALISRARAPRNGRANLTDREFVYRPAFELGRHVIGYELQKTLALVDWLKRSPGAAERPLWVVGYGEGGLLALYAAALDTRLDGAFVSGYFGPREEMWRQPLDRNVFSLVREFGDAETARLVYPRSLVIEPNTGPLVVVPGEGGGPGELTRPTLAAATAELARFPASARGLGPKAREPRIAAPPQEEGESLFCGAAALRAALTELGVTPRAAGTPAPRQPAPVDVAARAARQRNELDRHSQLLLAESPYVRAEFLARLDTSSPAKYAASVEPLREHFRRETIGWFDDERLPANPRTRLAYTRPTWVGYEVLLDVWPDVVAYGILCVPRNVATNGSDRRPVVVCQHGLEGRPQDIVTGDHPAYHDFAARLAERGFVTFAPQNLYIGHDAFRTLQRKANPLGRTLFSIIVPQHQQITDWLATLPFVDADRIGFYGLSYGGKSAMRIPPLVPRYQLSICSADFNDWVDKNASTRAPYSYVWTGEYEIFEWDLGSTFNYAEMAALICPRPFMVERGHFDGVGVDERVASEFAKVRHLYQAKMKLPPGTCEIEWFDGPHTIHGRGTFDFLHRHLRWPAPQPSVGANQQ